MTTKILGTQIQAGTIQTEQLANNVTVNFATTSEISDYATSAGLAEFATSLAPKITSINIANSSFAVLDDTAVNIGGGYIVVTGSNFQSGATVIVDTTSASAVTYINSNTLNVQVPARPAATYNLFVVNPDGGTGIKVSALTYSGTPTWVTASPLSYGVNNRVFAINLSATPATSYAVANGSSLPAGTTLLANGYFYGVGTVGVDTTYSFDVVATDAELQDSSKTFGLTVYLTRPRELFAWGWNNSGQLGLNDIINRSSPVQVGTGLDWSTFTTSSGGSTFGIKNTGTLWSWGSNTFGQLGFNDLINRSSPVQVGANTDWSIISAAGNCALATKTNGTLWAWGQNTYGVLGLNDLVLRSSPTQIGTGTDWYRVSSQLGNLAIKTNGTLWAWGRSLNGQFGLNDLVHRSSPTQVGTGTDWSFVSHFSTSTSAIKTNSTLWTFGLNSNGQLGSNNRVDRSSPAQVGTDTNWLTTASGTSDMAAIKTTGTLWAWGNGTYGQLGINVQTARSSPVQVGALTNWSNVQSTQNGYIALKTDGTMWVWGRNDQGQLGRNNTVNISSPVQVGTLSGNQSWLDIGADNGLNTLAIGEI